MIAEMVAVLFLVLGAFAALLAAWGFIVTAAVIALAPLTGLAAALAGAGVLHLALGLAASALARARIRAAKARRRDMLLSFAAKRAALTLFPHLRRASAGPRILPALLVLVFALAALLRHGRVAKPGVPGATGEG